MMCKNAYDKQHIRVNTNFAFCHLSLMSEGEVVLEDGFITMTLTHSVAKSTYTKIKDRLIQVQMKGIPVY